MNICTDVCTHMYTHCKTCVGFNYTFQISNEKKKKQRKFINNIWPGSLKIIIFIVFLIKAEK